MISSESLVTLSINAYRRRAPTPVEGCIIDGRSCSQRFEEVFKSALENGDTAFKSFRMALFFASSVCMEINGVSQLRAQTSLILGTAGTMVLGREWYNLFLDSIRETREAILSMYLARTLLGIVPPIYWDEEMCFIVDCCAGGPPKDV